MYLIIHYMAKVMKDNKVFFITFYKLKYTKSQDKLFFFFTYVSYED